jgi:hypothetical protein
MVRYGIQGPEELFSELQPMFGDDEKVGMQICAERIRIFNDLLAACGGRCLDGGDCHVCGDAPAGPWLPDSLYGRTPDDVRVVSSPFETQPGEEYRLHRDLAHVVRIRFKLPVTGKQVGLFARDVPVAGISFPEALENAKAFIAGCDRSLLLERDPGNRHDPNAIRVIGRWRGASGSEHAMQIGWLPREVAAMIASQAEGPPHLWRASNVVQTRRRKESRHPVWDLGVATVQCQPETGHQMLLESTSKGLEKHGYVTASMDKAAIQAIE